ncbi:hypothetical protein D3C71_2211860 [compost metagenome]
MAVHRGIQRNGRQAGNISSQRVITRVLGIAGVFTECVYGHVDYTKRLKLPGDALSFFGSFEISKYVFFGQG